MTFNRRAFEESSNFDDFWRASIVHDFLLSSKFIIKFKCKVSKILTKKLGFRIVTGEQVLIEYKGDNM